MARYLSRADLSRIAGKYIDQYYTCFGISKDNPSPINLEQFASSVLGLNVKMLPLCSDGSILGLTVFQKCRFTVILGDGTKLVEVFMPRDVVIDSALAADRCTGCRNFTIAHEVAHQILADLFPNDYGKAVKCRGHIAYEGYGVKRICNYLVENHIMGRNGKNIPTTTLVRMVRNKCYTGYLINGNVEKECPELRIIEQEVFDRAQELRDTRRREKGEDSDSYSPHALLCGKVFCAHCGNRLNITSSGRTRLRADGSTVKEKRFRYSCHYNVRHPGQCDGQSGYGVTKLDAIVESIVCTKFSEILECSKSKLLQDMLRKDMEVAQKEVSRAKSELDLKDDERNALKDEMIRVIRGKSSIDRDMIQQLLDENQAAIQAAQDALTAAQNKLEEIEQENKKAENDCSNLFTWASTYQNASFQQRQAILNQFIKEVRVGRDYDIEIILNVPLEEFEEFKSHSLSVRTPSGRKTDLKQAPVRGLGTPNGGIVVFDKTSGEAMNIMPKSSAHVTLRCQDE